jgi:hypothetical protein
MNIYAADGSEAKDYYVLVEATFLLKLGIVNFRLSLPSMILAL